MLSCAGETGGEASSAREADGELFETSDLSLFELRDRVKRVTTNTYYNVTLDADSVIIDSVPANVVTTEVLSLIHI